MIIITPVWLCLITHVVYSTIITVNNNGNHSVACCMNGTCPCSSLSSALQHIQKNNTVINVTSESITLHDIVEMGSGNLNNITVTGNGATIMCNNTGGVYCESCSDITIMGITWYQCGSKDSEYPVTQTPAFALTNVSSEILIQNCTFRDSAGCPVYIQNAKGNVLITGTSFVSNVFDFPIYLDFSDSICAGLYLSSNSQIVLSVNNSRFEDNGCASDFDCYCVSAMIESNNYVSEYNQFSFENTNFSDNYGGLSLKAIEKAAIKLLNVRVSSNICFGIYILMSGGTNYSAGTVSVSSATFIDNGLCAICFAGITGISSVNISTSSSSFIDNEAALSITVDEKSVGLSVDIDSSNFSSTRMRPTIFIQSTANLTLLTVSNSFFCNNHQGAVNIKTSTDATEFITANIVFTNVTIYNVTNNYFVDTSIYYIETENTNVSIMFKRVRFLCLTTNTGILLIENRFTHCYLNNYPVSVKLTECTFHANTALDNVVALNIMTDNNPYCECDTHIELFDCHFDHNIGGKSIVYIYTPSTPNLDAWRTSVILDNSTFSNNKGAALHLLIRRFRFEGNILFSNNTAIDGAAVYLEEVYAISSDDNANVQFVNNSAEQKGGAMYINLLNADIYYSYSNCNVFNDISNTSNFSFINNSAGVAGNSIYFSISQTCQIITNTSDKSSLLYFTNKFKYSQPIYSIHSPVVTSPYNMKLYPPALAVDNSSNDYLIQESKMLGEPVQFIASVFDYFNNFTEPVTFSINCQTCGDDYRLSTYQITVHDHSIYDLKIFPTVLKRDDVVNNTNISITLMSALLPMYKSINSSLSIELSPCRAGYLFDNVQGQCFCYPHSHLVHCKVDYVEIKIGYWIGYLTKQHYTSSVCPSNYCNSEYMETSPGFYGLRGKSDDQCSSHRIGVACGECKPGYTLAYDSPDCINSDKKCSAGMTILVIALTILYWIAIVIVVFGLMYFQFQISSGYAYGIIYYYSIVDILLVNNVSKEVFQLVGILSSFAKLTPQLFGQLCLVEGLSGIDQQFIHYSHALAVSLILLIIVLAAKRSGRLTRFISPCIIRVICLVILLSYTSLATTSLQLLRPLTFNNVDEVRTYSSPDITYFTGRHLVYAIVAILCEVIIVIGLPLFLLLEPFLRQRVNFVKIKPLLDQFQGCYKDKYRWFAAYYLICRQVIILIVYVGNENYYYMLYGLQTACIIIVMIHGCVQPYKNNLLNGLDEVILLILVMIVNLNLFSSLSIIPTNYFSFVLVMLPLLLLCLIIIRKFLTHFCNRKKRVLRLYNPVEVYEENENYNNERRLNVNKADNNYNEFQESLLDYSDD